MLHSAQRKEKNRKEVLIIYKNMVFVAKCLPKETKNDKIYLLLKVF